MMKTMALLGIASALLIGCADDAQDPARADIRFNPDYDLVEVIGGTGTAPDLRLVAPGHVLAVGEHAEPLTFVEFDQDVIGNDQPEDGALSNGLEMNWSEDPADGALSGGQGQIWDDGRGLVAQQNNRAIGDLGAVPAGDEPADACACTTADCVIDWIDVNLGCNVCVTFTCDDAPFAAGCNACE